MLSSHLSKNIRCIKPLEHRSTMHVIESLDKKLYCGTCGRFTNGIICLACNKENGEKLKKAAQAHVSEKEASLIRNVVLVICQAEIREGKRTDIFPSVRERFLPADEGY